MKFTSTIGLLCSLHGSVCCTERPEKLSVRKAKVKWDHSLHARPLTVASIAPGRVSPLFKLLPVAQKASQQKKHKSTDTPATET
eukprot:11130590-Karenia_brevis.AAC.1